MKLCCEPANICLANAGGRGMSFLLKRYAFGIGLILQQRTVAFKDISVFSEAIKVIPQNVLVNVSFQQGLSYCPFCGTKFEKTIACGDVKELDALADDHAQLLSQ